MANIAKPIEQWTIVLSHYDNMIDQASNKDAWAMTGPWGCQAPYPTQGKVYSIWRGYEDKNLGKNEGRNCVTLPSSQSGWANIDQKALTIRVQHEHISGHLQEEEAT